MKREEALRLLEPAGLQKSDAILRARALWQIARINGRKDSPAIRAMFAETKDPRILTLAIRIARDYLDWDARHLMIFPNAIRETVGFLPTVSREALLAIRDKTFAGTDTSDDFKKNLYDLMKHYDGKDRFYLAAVGIAVGHHDEKRREVLLADFPRHFK